MHKCRGYSALENAMFCKLFPQLYVIYMRTQTVLKLVSQIITVSYVLTRPNTNVVLATPFDYHTHRFYGFSRRNRRGRKYYPLCVTFSIHYVFTWQGTHIRKKLYCFEQIQAENLSQSCINDSSFICYMIMQIFALEKGKIRLFCEADFLRK